MARTLSRRGLLRATGAGCLAGLAGCTDALSGGDALTIGVLQPMSGDLSYYGEQSLWGFFSGLAHKGDADPIEDASTGSHTATVDDTEYELLVRDTEFSADTAQSVATDLVENEDVDLLFGTASSEAAGRVVETVVNTAEVPMMAGPAASASLTSSSETCSDIVFRASENTAMDARSGGRYVANETDISAVYLFGADYSFGRAVVENYQTVLEDNDVEVLDTRYVPQGYSEWEGLLDNAEEAGAEGVVGGFTVSTLPQMFTSYLQGDYSYDVFGGLATRITNAAVGQTLQQALGDDLSQEDIDESGLGPFTTRYHWNQYDNEINSSFVETYTDTYGVVPDLFSAGTFTAASAIAQAVEESGSTDGSDIAEALRGMTVTDTPKGEDAYTFQEYNNQARSAMTVADLAPTSEEWEENWDAPVMPGEPLATIDADQTTIPEDSSAMECSL
ncbi:MAG: ABC transporter substrate-binding protein [Halolamina sp.]